MRGLVVVIVALGALALLTAAQFPIGENPRMNHEYPLPSGFQEAANKRLEANLQRQEALRAQELIMVEEDRDQLGLDMAILNCERSSPFLCLARSPEIFSVFISYQYSILYCFFVYFQGRLLKIFVLRGRQSHYPYPTATELA